MVKGSSRDLCIPTMYAPFSCYFDLTEALMIAWIEHYLLKVILGICSVLLFPLAIDSMVRGPLNEQGNSFYLILYTGFLFITSLFSYSLTFKLSNYLTIYLYYFTITLSKIIFSYLFPTRSHKTPLSHNSWALNLLKHRTKKKSR